MDTAKKTTIDVYCDGCIYWGDYSGERVPDKSGKCPCRIVMMMTGGNDYCSFGKASKEPEK